MKVKVEVEVDEDIDVDVDFGLQGQVSVQAGSQVHELPFSLGHALSAPVCFQARAAVVPRTRCPTDWLVLLRPTCDAARLRAFHRASVFRRCAFRYHQSPLQRCGYTPERVVLNLCSLVPAPAVGGFQPSVGSATDTRETSAGGPRTAPRPPLRGTMPFTPEDGAAACSRSCPSGDCDLGAFFVCKWYAHTSTIDAGPQDTARHVVNILCTAAVARLHLTDADPRADAMALFRSEREDTGERIHQIWTVTARNFDDITFDAVMFQTFRASHAVLIHVLDIPCARPAWEHGAPQGFAAFDDGWRDSLQMSGEGRSNLQPVAVLVQQLTTGSYRASERKYVACLDSHMVVLSDFKDLLIGHIYLHAMQDVSFVPSPPPEDRMKPSRRVARAGTGRTCVDTSAPSGVHSPPGCCHWNQARGAAASA